MCMYACMYDRALRAGSSQITTNVWYGGMGWAWEMGRERGGKGKWKIG